MIGFSSVVSIFLGKLIYNHCIEEAEKTAESNQVQVEKAA